MHLGGIADGMFIKRSSASECRKKDRFRERDGRALSCTLVMPLTERGDCPDLRIKDEEIMACDHIYHPANLE